MAEPVTFEAAPAYASMGTLGTEGTSNYNALQVSLNNNLWHGLFFTFAYTYSHALDDASGLESSGFNGPGTNYYPGYHHLSYGSSDFDARHRVVASYDYGIPLLASMNRQAIVKEALGELAFRRLYGPPIRLSGRHYRFRVVPVRLLRRVQLLRLPRRTVHIHVQDPQGEHPLHLPEHWYCDLL